MTTVTITAQGQVTFRKNVLQQLGIRPGDQIDFVRFRESELRTSVERLAGSIKGFIGLLSGSTNKMLSSDELNETAAAGWAGESDASAKPEAGPVDVKRSNRSKK